MIADNPSLTVRGQRPKQPRRIVLDTMARTPLIPNRGRPVAHLTTIMSANCSKRVRALGSMGMLMAPTGRSVLLMRVHPVSGSTCPGFCLWCSECAQPPGRRRRRGERLLLHRLAHCVAFFYAPKVLGGRDSVRAVAGGGASILPTHFVWATSNGEGSDRICF